MEKKITVFTPTYNRLETLKKTYQSLLYQTEKNFIWLVIDDGSCDRTDEWIEKVKKENLIEIMYIYQENGGKHRAHNTAVKNLKTDYMLILDSDDFLRKDAIQLLNQKIKEIDNNDKVCGIIGARKNIFQKNIKENMPDVKYVDTIELYQKYKFEGETVIMLKKQILLNNLFPEINNEKFVSESVIFNNISCNYKFLVIKEKIYYYSYRLDGYTRNYEKINKNNPIGYMLFLKSNAETSILFKERLKKTILYIIWCKRNNIKNNFHNFQNKILYIISFPIANLLYISKYPKNFF